MLTDSSDRPLRRPRSGARTQAVQAPARTKAARPLQRSDDDAQLLVCLSGMRERQQIALASLYDATASRLFSVALRILRSTELAEEVVSDTYMQAWRDCERYDPARGKVLAWLLIICRSRALDALRRADEAFSHPDPYELLSEEQQHNGRDDPQNLLQALQGNGRLTAALGLLSAQHRQLLALAFFKGLSHAEIAEHARMPLGSVKTHIRKALAALRSTLGPDPDLR